MVHLRHKQIKKRYRDAHIAKDLEARAWADPLEVARQEGEQEEKDSPDAVNNKAQAKRKVNASKGHKLSGGTIYNQFYRTNAETSPMKALAPNLESQIDKLEKI